MAGSIHLETFDGPGLEQLRDFVFCTHPFIPVDQMPTCKARGLRTKTKTGLVLRYYQASRVFPFTTLVEGGSGFCTIRLQRIVQFKPYQPAEEVWEFCAEGEIVSGEGETYEAWISDAFGHKREEQRAKGYLTFVWKYYCTRNREGLLWDIR